MYEYKKGVLGSIMGSRAIFSFSLSLPSSHKYWTDLIVGGGSAGHPRRVFVVLQFRARMKGRL
jgi:hypothetical protein